MTDIRRRPIDLMDSPEHRSIPIDSFEVEDSDDNTLTLTGYASTFQPYEMYGGPSNGMGWIEQIDRGAFERTLKEGPDLHLLINHEGLPLARTKSGDLDLSVDDHGLKVVARLDRSDPDVQRLEPKMRKRAGQTRPLMDEMSFAFRVKGQEWSSTPEHEDDPQASRKITEVSLHKGDVSVMNWGANPTTHAELKSLPDALRILAECDESELVELRSNKSESLAKAKAKLAAVDGAITIPVRAKLAGIDGPTGTFIDGVIDSRAAEGDDTNTMIASLDAVLDEAFSLITDVDEEALDAKVAQALDLLRGAWIIVGKLMETLGICDPDENDPGERANADETEKRESVSDHPWDFPQSAYTPEQWRHACLIDTGKGDPDSKGRFREPVREPDGTLNRRGVHAAAGRLDQVDGISDEQRTLAAKKLVSLYRDQLHEDPPPHLLDMAHERSESMSLEERMEALVTVLERMVDHMDVTKRDDDMEEDDLRDDDEEMSDDDGGEESLDDDEEYSGGMSLSEARSQENTLSLAELLDLE